MPSQLLTPREVDILLRYPAGRTARLVRAGKIPAATLPDGEVRIPRDVIDRITTTITNSHSAEGAVSDAR